MRAGSGGSAKVAPGPRGIPWLGNVRDFGKDALGFLLRLNRDFGGVARFHLGTKVAHLISDPSLVKYVLQENYRNYRKGAPYRPARHAFGLGLITSDGEHWHRQRKLMQPVFHKRHYDNFATIMSDATVPMLDKWSRKTGRPLNVAADLRDLALRIAARSLLSTDIDEHADFLTDRFNDVQLWFTSGSKTGYLVPPSFPLPANLRLKKTLRELDALVYSVIAARRRARDRPIDLLTMLIEARDEDDGSGMTDEELRDEMMTLLFAAHESTGTTIAWAMSLLSKYPLVAQRVRAEIAEILEGRAPTIDDVAELAYTRRVADETMRLYPAGSIIPREVIDDDEVGAFLIPAGSIVFVSPYVQHRDPTHWRNPEAFDPDRFLPERAADRHKYSYIPFLRGPRQCLGNHFAIMEFLIALPMIMQRFEFELIPSMPVTSAHMRFSSGMYMNLREVA